MLRNRSGDLIYIALSSYHTAEHKLTCLQDPMNVCVPRDCVHVLASVMDMKKH